MIKYNEFIQNIKEGLIRTHNIEKYSDNLEIELKSIGINNYKIDIISKYVFTLTINTEEVNNDSLKYIVNHIQNMFGYLASYIWLKNNKNMENSFMFDEKYLNNKYNEIKIRFESKYDDGLYSNNIETPNTAYHLSPIDFKDKILKNGLYPKTKFRKTNHNERIYLFYKLNHYSDILSALKLNDKMKNKVRNYSLYEVYLNSKIISHKDPNYSNGFYIYDNISPKNVKLLKDNL